ncbi:uncharacterized protein LOC123396939 [Hordeum vulgare subsp. vulgare]|uniref:uncharacterized protein LOC123396939 n=1 Tax=Hordeum vulgare subsp. vulgare TaxID=112509 RepID=UPI001D1A555D|nr:uncharacterized protein LOC123396939 [Hordeum vulgare subsp. vulgare]
MHQVQDEELEQTWGTEGAETIGDNLADSNGIAGKDELEENKSTQSTDSGLSEVTEELTDNETSKQTEACGDEELEQTSGREGAEIIGDKLPMPAQTWKPIGLHNKPKKARDYVVAPEGTDKSFYALVLLHLFSSLLINVITYIMIDYACTGDDWSVIENIMSVPNDKRTLIYVPVNIEDFHWYLAVINSGVRRIQVLDSLGPGMNRKDLTAMLEGLENVFQYASLQIELKFDKWKDINITAWPREECIKSSLQTDGSSCGLWMINFMEYFTGNDLSDTPTQERMGEKL